MKRRLVAVLALLVACSHGEPYGIPMYGTDQGTAASRRLTYSVLVDSEASFVPGGPTVMYSALRADFPDTTFCIEQLPLNVGQATASWCPLGPEDSSRAYQAPAVSPKGRFLYLRSARTQPNLGWSVRQLMLTDLLGATPRAILSSPFPQYTGLSQIRWLTEDRFVFRADLYVVVMPCSACLPYDTSSGLFLVAGELVGDSATFTTIPGTSGATSVAVAAADTILYTLAYDTKVYWRAMTSGVVGTRRDFAPDVPDNVQVAGARLAVTLHGLPAYADGDSAAAIRVDVVPYTGLALSPDGKRLVAQRDGDLWLLELP